MEGVIDIQTVCYPIIIKNNLGNKIIKKKWNDIYYDKIEKTNWQFKPGIL